MSKPLTYALFALRELEPILPLADFCRILQDSNSKPMSYDRLKLNPGINQGQQTVRKLTT